MHMTLPPCGLMKHSNPSNLSHVKQMLAWLVQARPSNFLDSFPGWTDNFDALPHPHQPDIDWSDIPSLSASLDEDASDTEKSCAIEAAARNSLGDGPLPEMVSAHELEQAACCCIHYNKLCFCMACILEAFDLMLVECI